MGDDIKQYQDFSKLKVADLRKVLKERGLNTTGTKTQLLERLEMACNGDSAALILESESTHGETEDIDEDDLLEGEGALEDELGDLSGKTDDLEVSSKVAQNELSPTELPGGEKKKFVLKRKVLQTVDNKPSEESVDLVTKNGDTSKKIKVTQLTHTERLQLRAQRFGVQTPNTRQDARAIRFQLDSKTIDPKTDVDILKKRAERFGASVSSAMAKIEMDEKIRKRQERFGIVQHDALTSKKTLLNTKVSTKPTNSELEDKKLLRAQRFNLNK